MQSDSPIQAPTERSDSYLKVEPHGDGWLAKLRLDDSRMLTLEPTTDTREPSND